MLEVWQKVLLTHLKQFYEVVGVDCAVTGVEVVNNIAEGGIREMVDVECADEGRILRIWILAKGEKSFKVWRFALQNVRMAFNQRSIDFIWKLKLNVERVIFLSSLRINLVH